MVSACKSHALPRRNGGILHRSRHDGFGVGSGPT
jgi:hypothetical protein